MHFWLNTYKNFNCQEKNTYMIKTIFIFNLKCYPYLEADGKAEVGTKRLPAC